MLLVIEIISLDFIILLILSILLCYYLSCRITHPQIKRYEDTYQWEIKHGTISKDKIIALEKEEVFISSPFGYKIHGFFFPCCNSQKAIIVCHGYTWSLCGSIKYVEMFQKKGFSVMIYDHRNHGKSGGKDTSFGYYEKFDLKACSDWILNSLGEDILIGLLGESMGAGTALQNIAIDPRISFCIADCGYSDIYTLFKYHMKRIFKIKRLPLIAITSAITKLRKGWSFKDVSPIKALSEIDTPVLFIHGEADEVIPNWMSKDMYKAKRGIKGIYIAPDAAHVQTFINNKQEYEKVLDGFLKDIGITAD
ncbi:MAG: alpha/beta hydrolase [Bacillota bacterium]|nr:alpha/beta hydrolase [Bacillota bacterium]